jgi:hypothetical protein
MEVIERGTGSIEGTAVLFFRSRIKKEMATFALHFSRFYISVISFNPLLHLFIKVIIKQINGLSSSLQQPNIEK